MKLALVLAVSLLALTLVPAASAWPPVCLEKGAGALGTSVSVQITCGPQVTLSHCPPVGEGPCWMLQTERLLP
jgi:hypothetical protein